MVAREVQSFSFVASITDVTRQLAAHRLATWPEVFWSVQKETNSITDVISVKRGEGVYWHTSRVFWVESDQWCCKCRFGTVQFSIWHLSTADGTLKAVSLLLGSVFMTPTADKRIHPLCLLLKFLLLLPWWELTIFGSSDIRSKSRGQLHVKAFLATSFCQPGLHKWNLTDWLFLCYSYFGNMTFKTLLLLAIINLGNNLSTASVHKNTGLHASSFEGKESHISKFSRPSFKKCFASWGHIHDGFSFK